MSSDGIMIMARYPLNSARRSLPVLCLAVFGLASCSDSISNPPRVVHSLLEQRRDKVIVQQWDVSCGAAALASLLTYDLSTPVTEKEVAAEMLRYTSVERVQSQLGFSLLDLKRYSESHDFVADGYGDMTLRDLIEAGPSIVPVVLNGFNHFMVFRGVQGDRVLLADPAWGNRTVQMPEFVAMWKTRVAFTVTRKGDAPALHHMAARTADFWSSSTVFESTEKKQVVAQLIDKAPDASQRFASVETPDPLSTTAAGPASGIAHGGRAESIDAIGASEVKKNDRKDADVSARPASRVVATRSQPAPKLDITVAHAVPAPAGAPATDQPPPSAPDRSAVETLLQQAETFIDQRDILRARIYYELAANLGSVQGAVGAGRTYDPQFLATADTESAFVDMAAATKWYGAALDMMRRSAEARLHSVHST